MAAQSLELCIALFGVSPIRLGGKPVKLALAGPTLSLLRYLLVYPGRPVRREYLADVFWDGIDPERRRGALSSAVWRINKALRPCRGIALAAERETLRMRIDGRVSVDAHGLAEAVRGAVAENRSEPTALARLAEALECCKGPFLGGSVEDWALAERERLNTLRLRGWTLMMQWSGRSGRYEEALEYGRNVLEEDPFRESAQCEVMWLYVLNRQRAQALRQYESYRCMLRKELDIDPLPETRMLYAHIRTGLDGKERLEPEAHPASRPARGEAPLNALFGAIEQSRRSVYAALRANAGEAG